MQENLDVIAKIRKDIRDGILQGKYAVGGVVPSELQLAASYAVGRATARQALRDLESEGFITRSRGSRSRVAPREAWAKNVLHCSGAGLLAVAVPTYQSLYCRRIVEAFNAGASAAEYQSITYAVSFTMSHEVEFLRHVGEIGVKGLALWLQHDTPETAAILSALRDRGCAVVLIDHGEEEAGLDRVVTDNRALGRMLTEGLIQRGHSQIAFVRDTNLLSSTRARGEGWRDALEAAGLEAPPEMEGGIDPAAPEMETVLLRIMARRRKPTALYCSHDSLAIAVADCLLGLGYRIPEDVEIATSDDDEFAARRGIPMLLATQPGTEIGRAAAGLLMRRVGAPDSPPESLVLPPVGGVTAYQPR